ncbi:hypothetical protein H6F93_20560 [Leptolyngbya sp. FACHB-671]|uniref:hypothetical protein n=1 Tax=Leptolyngbya sp. FACHB-671 TaxID=2692812 RepID=UPI00168954AD|nr:hypothetical protein [Leptolyngbya sp. FACHB-671]MBD2069877.1 hypothetical protein [Leptolyngbya sp. FACHB-671]
MVSGDRQNWLPVLGKIAVALGCVLGIGLLQQPQLDRLKRSASDASPEELSQQDAAENVYLDLVQRSPAFGFDNLVADWIFLDFLQYFGDNSARNQIGYGLSPEYFEAILNHDPYFRDAYLFLSGSTTLYAGRPDRTVEIMNQHIGQLSPRVPDKAYFVWRYKGTDELLFLGDSQAARQSFETAVEWASIYSDPESQAAAQVSQQTAEYLAENPESKSAQIAAWVMVLGNAFDEETQRYAISQIEALGGNVSVDEQGRLQIQQPEGN